MPLFRPRPGLVPFVVAFATAAPFVASGWQAAPQPPVSTAQSPAPPQVAAQPQSELPPARTIIDRHLAAVGGREAITTLKSIRSTGTVSVPSAGLSGTLEAFQARPNKVVTKTTLPGVGDVVDGFDGKIGWAISPLTGPSLLQGKQLEQKKFDSDFDAELKGDSRYSSITTIEQTTFDGRPCYKLRLLRAGSDAGDEEFELYDSETGLRAGSIITRETDMGPIVVTSTFTGYKKFGKLLAPTSLKQSMMGLQTEVTITAVEFDKVDPAVFDPPPPIKALIK